MHCMQPALHDGQLLEGPWRFKLTIAMAVPGAIMMIAMMGEEARVTNFFSLKFDVGQCMAARRMSLPTAAVFPSVRTMAVVMIMRRGAGMALRFRISRVK